MTVSTRGRYALRVLIDLAEHADGEFTPLRALAARQEISQKYLESIMVLLARAGFIEGAHGKGGGYRLRRAPEEIRAGDILRETEGTLAPVACLQPGTPPCPRAAHCRTLPLWQGLDRLIANYLDSFSLADLMQRPDGGDYVI